MRYLKRKNPVLPPQEEEGGLTFQFAGEKGEKAVRRIYVWGNAQYGALGQFSFLMPRKPKQSIVTQMFKPYR